MIWARARWISRPRICTTWPTGNRLITPDIEHSLQDEVRVQSGGSKGGCVACLECEREQDSGVERAVVVGIARQNEPVSQGFGINRVQIGHVASSPPVSRRLNEKTPENEGGFQLRLV